jgi:uncharacterized membrane protein
MAWLILGVVLFLGPHSVRIFADDWRTRTIEKVGDKAYKGMYTVLTLIGFYALIVGYADARMQPPSSFGSRPLPHAMSVCC